LTEDKAMNAVIRHLRAAALCCKGEGPTDGQLLESFVIRREEIAFEALVRRHGPMVFGVCRRILQNVHDAEDAFQATFLVLSRKAATVKPRDMVGNWLYGVAYRTAMKSRGMRVKRQAKEKQVAELSRVQAPAGNSCEDLLMQLDHELNRLPDRYRVPIVLCELEGRSRREAARMLGIPEGTLSSRLAQAKKLLARKLSRHGGLCLAALISATAASACLTPGLRAATVKTVFSAGSIPAKVLALTEGVMKAMLLTKLKITVCAATLMLLAGVGATGLTYRATAEEPKPLFTRSVEGRPQADDLESLRLEIEALRKELRATRDRVKALEEEVRGQKGQKAAQPKQPLRPAEKERVKSELQKELESARREIEKELESARREIEREMKSVPGGVQISDILSKVEEELKKTLEQTNDKQVTEAIEKALRGLKEREKAKGRGEGKPKERR
jgi:RNA polymerase sigma factor (sigma-70 family)